MFWRLRRPLGTLVLSAGLFSIMSHKKAPVMDDGLPVEIAPLLAPPFVPPPITRKHPARVVARLVTKGAETVVSGQSVYPFWTYNGTVPGPFIRTRVGDTLDVVLKNEDDTPHNVDLHACHAPGGGAAATLVDQGETKSASFKLMYPGLYVYHCAAAPVPMHIANGMYGLILVEPEGGLPKVDKEYYVMQSEIYASDPTASADGTPRRMLEPSYFDGLAEHPRHVVFNGRAGALTDNPLTSKTGERVRLFFGNGGPNLSSAFHVIGQIFDNVYRDGGLIDPPARALQTVLVPPGGSTVVEMVSDVPGTYTLVDHAIFRIDKGAIGFLRVTGDKRPELYQPHTGEAPCAGCKLHN